METKQKNTKAKQWQQKQFQQNQNKFTNYFGKPLDGLCTPDGGCPVFVLKAIKHVEANGMFIIYINYTKYSFVTK